MGQHNSNEVWNVWDGRQRRPNMHLHRTWDSSENKLRSDSSATQAEPVCVEDATKNISHHGQQIAPEVPHTGGRGRSHRHVVEQRVQLVLLVIAAAEGLVSRARLLAHVGYLGMLQERRVEAARALVAAAQQEVQGILCTARLEACL